MALDEKKLSFYLESPRWDEKAKLGFKRVLGEYDRYEEEVEAKKEEMRERKAWADKVKELIRAKRAKQADKAKEAEKEAEKVKEKLYEVLEKQKQEQEREQ